MMNQEAHSDRQGARYTVETPDKGLNELSGAESSENPIQLPDRAKRTADCFVGTTMTVTALPLLPRTKVQLCTASTSKRMLHLGVCLERSTTVQNLSTILPVR
jgi:hypothetical protein